MKTLTLTILSTPLLLEEGTFSMRQLSHQDALDLVRWHTYHHSLFNFCGHETVKLLGLSPAKTREECKGYTLALVGKPRARLEFGREYSIEEIDAIGVDWYLISDDEFIREYDQMRYEEGSL